MLEKTNNGGELWKVSSRRESDTWELEENNGEAEEE
jgi:hypothetical protein